MPKKNWTEAERVAFGEKMKAARLAKQKQQADENKNPQPLEKQTTDRPSITETAAMDKLLERISGLEAQLKQRRASEIEDVEQPFKVDTTGETAGVLYKYPVSRDYYPDPTAQLIHEPFLKRFAFEDNYILKWDVDGMVYETKWGTTVAEPKFTMVLYQRQFDPSSGEPTGKLIRIQQLNIFEDPGSVRQLLVELDIDTAGMSEKQIFDLIRYHRISEWLKAIFQPPTNIGSQRRSTETVIDGRVVVMEEESSVLGV